MDSDYDGFSDDYTFHDPTVQSQANRQTQYYFAANEDEYDDTDYTTQSHNFQSLPSSEPIDEWDDDDDEKLDQRYNHGPAPTVGQREFGQFISNPNRRPFAGSSSQIQSRDRPVSTWQQQPIQSYKPPPAFSQSIHQPMNQPKRGANPRNSHGIQLRPLTDLPDIYRGLFKFGVFNAVQSKCFDSILDSSDNLVVSAPTGSGKTVLFELAIIRMLSETKNTGQSMKAVYVAPTKALCSERFRDWTTKFEPLGVKCAELTGDTVIFGRGAWGDAKLATIIVTTSEKWDSLTRNWEDAQGILKMIGLFLVDEVHILNESRGSVLEVVMSRMRHRGSDVRFVLVSATVPNIQDIAAWIRLDSHTDSPAKVFEFGEEFRPCKLTRHVIGVHRPKQVNDYQFNRTLDFKLFGALQKHSSNKPILVFVSTRKGTSQTADQLKKEFLEAGSTKSSVPWTRPARVEYTFKDKTLNELAALGIGVHHAGLQLEDRRAVEDLFLKRTLRILVATSTLAVGVNLPAHTVVIKGVKMFQDGGMIEYSDLDIMQMLGRAGRPQFDNEGVAIILCETALEDKYRAMAQGRTILESHLHVNLVEHLNSEIGLGTINNLDSAKTWLRQSFLFQRIRQNPRRYSLGKDENQSWEERVDDLVLQSVAKLREAQLVEAPQKSEDPNELRLSEYGDIMSRFYIRQATMCQILALPEKVGTREMLELISSCEEVTSSKLRAEEKTALNSLKKHPEIRYPVKKVEGTTDKMMLLIQAQLACINLSASEFKSSDSQLTFEGFIAFKHLPRILRAVVEVAITRKLGTHMKYGLELLRSISAKAWDDRPYVFRQIESIGEKSIKILAEHGITTLDRLRSQDTLRIENLLNRRPPFGLEVLNALKELPHYKIEIEALDVRPSKGQNPVEIDIKIDCGLVVETQTSLKTTKRKNRSSNITNVLTLTSDLDFIDFRRIGTKALSDGRSFDLDGIQLAKPSQSIVVYISSDCVAGIAVTKSFKPQIPSNKYPTPDTRPVNSTAMDMEGLDDSGFWDIDDLSDDEVKVAKEEKHVTVRDLTQKNNNAPGMGVSTSKKPFNTGKDKGHVASPVKLSNGNYACNHACRDKSACRHLCCRDGLDKAPKRSQATKTSANKPLVSTSKAVVKAAAPESPQGSFAHFVKSKKSGVKVDTTLADLEDLHRRTNVSESIKLEEGRRIKVENAPGVSRYHKREKLPPPDYSIELSDLAPNEPPSTMYTLPDELPDDQDDLPDPSLLFSRDANKISKGDVKETSYDDDAQMEFDAIMETTPMDDYPYYEAPVSSKRKSPSPIIAAPPAKRFKFPAPKVMPKGENVDTEDRHINIPAQVTRQRTARPNRVSSPLFLSDQEEFQSPAKFAPAPSYNFGSATFPSKDINPVATSVPFAQSSSPVHNPHSAGSTSSKTLEDQVMEEDDELADLERWLYSGAIKIIDD